MPRLFTAIEVPKEIGMMLSALRGGVHGARWISPENYHLTLRFIGDIDERTANEVAGILDFVERPSFNVTLTGLDQFGGKKPRAIFAAVQPSPALIELQAEHERMMQRIGLPPEGRRFTPHVTLARLRDASVIDVADYLATRGGFRPMSFPVPRFVLYSSRASQGGGPYIVEAGYPLRGRAGLESRYASAI
ncbi:MAG: RNA 2',3'-cyclic phosphodiesterase [Xanthobacteraceae bacterium]|nr:RNA 2',3'-cyclic phosphodiesterase [Xanthobacteraceae bacterium]